MSKFTFLDKEEERNSAKRVDSDLKRRKELNSYEFLYLSCMLLAYLLSLGQEGMFFQVYKSSVCTMKASFIVKSSDDGGIIRIRGK